MVRVADRGCARAEGAPDSNKPPHAITTKLAASLGVFLDEIAPCLLIAGILLLLLLDAWKAEEGGGGGSGEYTCLEGQSPWGQIEVAVHEIQIVVGYPL